MTDYRKAIDEFRAAQAGGDVSYLESSPIAAVAEELLASLKASRRLSVQMMVACSEWEAKVDALAERVKALEGVLSEFTTAPIVHRARGYAETQVPLSTIEDARKALLKPKDATAHKGGD